MYSVLRDDVEFLYSLIPTLVTKTKLQNPECNNDDHIPDACVFTKHRSRWVCHP